MAKKIKSSREQTFSSRGSRHNERSIGWRFYLLAEIADPSSKSC